MSGKVNGGVPRNLTTPCREVKNHNKKKNETQNRTASRSTPKRAPQVAQEIGTDLAPPKKTVSEHPRKTKHNQRIHEEKHRKTIQRKTIRTNIGRTAVGEVEIKLLWVNSGKVVGERPENEKNP